MTVVQAVAVLWLASEVILAVATRTRRGAGTTRAQTGQPAGHARGRDRGSLALLWIAIVGGLACAPFLHQARAGSMPVPAFWLQTMGIVFCLGGLAIRWTAIVTLGRFFTTAVAIHDDQHIVRRGVYRRIRHPAYSGLLLVLLGIGLAYANWWSLAATVAPALGAVLYRIRVEERVMLEAFGEEYAAYREETKCLIPGVF